MALLLFALVLVLIGAGVFMFGLACLIEARKPADPSMARWQAAMDRWESRQ